MQMLFPILLRQPANFGVRQLTAKVQEQVPALQSWCTLIDCDKDGEKKVLAAALYRFNQMSFADALAYVKSLKKKERAELADTLLKRLTRYDIPLRELEYSTYTFDLVMDQGAYAEFKRHRMMTQTPQPLTVDLGYATPQVFVEASFAADCFLGMSKVHLTLKLKPI